MLELIRERAKGWVATVIVILIAITFAFWGVSNYFQAKGPTTTVASVNGQDINQGEVKALYEQLINQRQAMLGNNFSLNPVLEKQLKQQALNQLINQQILTQVARDNGFRVGQQQTEATLLNIPVFQEDGQFSEPRFIEVLRNMGSTPSAFVEQLRGDMLINQLQAGILRSAFSLPSDANDAIKLIEQRRDISYIVVPTKRFEKDVKVTNEQLQAYYDSHKAEFNTQEQVSLEYLELSLKDIMSGINVSDEALKHTYQDNISNYQTAPRYQVANILVKVPLDATDKQLIAANEKVAKIQKAIQAKQSFKQLAKEFSDDIASREKGGELPWFTHGTFDEEFEDAVASLKKKGDISEPIRTKYGFNIIKLLDVEKQQVIPFAKVKQEIETRMKSNEASQIFAQSTDELASITFSNPDSLSVAATALKLKVKSTQLFTSSTIDSKNDNNILNNRRVKAAAFSNDVLQGNNSDLIELDPEHVIVIRVKQHIPSNVKPFKDVQASIKNRLIEVQAKLKATEMASTILEALQDGQKPDAIAKKHNLSWISKKNIGRYSTDLKPTIIATAFRLPHPEKGKPHPVGSTSMANGDVAIVLVKSIIPGKYTENAKEQQANFRKQAESRRGQLDFQLYFQGKVKEADIDIK